MGGVAEGAVVGVMGGFDADAAAVADQAVEFLHGADDVGKVFDHVDGTEVIEAAVGERVGEPVEVDEDVGGAGGVEVDADCAGEFSDAAADVESSQEFRVSGYSYDGRIVKLLSGMILAAALYGQEPAASSSFLLKGGTVHTISGPVIENGSILVRDGKIVGVGKKLAAPEGVPVIDVTGKQVYPGMIDSASSTGIDKDDLTETGLFNPQMNPAKVVNPESDFIPATRANGVTSVMEMANGELIAGQISLVHMDGFTVDEMTTARGAAVHLIFPTIATQPVPIHESEDDDEEPTTAVAPAVVPYPEAKHAYDEKMKALREFFDAARRYRHAKQAKGGRRQEIDLRYEAMIPVLDGEQPMIVTAVREREIREAIAFAQQEKIRIILADPYEAYKVMPLIKSHNISVVLGPTYMLPLEWDDAYDQSYTTPSQLYKAGIKFSIATFSSKGSRNLPYQAAAAVPFGLPHDEAYKAVSLNAAEILGLGKKLGSIDEGKVADLIVTDGDPLETATHVTMEFIDGKPVNLDTRQKKLYEKYLARP